MPRSPGRTGRPWLRLRQQVLAEEDTCYLCGHEVDKTLPGTHRHGPTVEHVIPLSRGGDPRDRNNCRLAHKRCNSARGNRPITTRQRRTSRQW